ncbi:MAG: hypothetical protein HKN43_01040, partial [Rhodothermales bacterium]|nr:hypothetical protein [Rhodothermales bacterium]
GLYHLLEMVDIERILQSENDYDSELFRKTSLRTKLAGVAEHVPGTATTVDIPCFRTHILGRGPQTDVNNRSLVVRIDYGSTSFLFTGDIESEVEQFIVGKMRSVLSVDVIKVPHHGSRTSSSLAFVRSIQSQKNLPFAVISFASNNRFGLPDEEIVDRWREMPARVLTTASEGAVWLQSDGRAVHRIHWR